jgi:hypothetical protein
LANQLQRYYAISNDKDRIAKLRDALRDTTQLKLSLVAIDSNLSQLRESATREATTVRQILSATPSRGPIGPNQTADQLRNSLKSDDDALSKANDEIDQDRKVLRALGGSVGEQLQMIDILGPDPFGTTVVDKLAVVKDAVRSILNQEKDDSSGRSSEQQSPPPTVAPPPPRSDTSAEPALKDSESAPAKSPQVNTRSDASTFDKSVEGALRLFRNVGYVRYLNQKMDFTRPIFENRKRLDDYQLVNAKIADLRDQIGHLQSKISSFQDAINQNIDASVNQIGGRDFFTLVATGIFGAAVVVVIGAFFALAFRDKDNRFLVNPDIGLQFVTLFSIIIAIILFGVLQILEGKELSALLGGISGYILGRGTLGWKGSNAGNPPSPPAPAGSNPTLGIPSAPTATGS